MNIRPGLDPKYCCFPLRYGESRIHRWGVFARERIPANRKVIEYTGELISRREAKRRGNDRRLIYLFALDSYWSKDGAVGGSGAELINHSCNPNLRTMILHRHILYLSRRVIEPGEELTVDYHFSADEQEFHCACGTSNCRGFINRKD